MKGVLPAIIETGVDPAAKIFFLEVFFANELTEEARTLLAASTPRPFLRGPTLMGPIVHVCTELWPDVDLRIAYDAEVHGFVARLGDLSAEEIRDRVDGELDPEAGEAEWRAFWDDIAHFIEVCSAAAPVVFVGVSAPLECEGYEEALARGRASVVDALADRLTAMYEAGVGLGDNATLFDNIAWAVAWSATGRGRALDAMTAGARAKLARLARAALARNPEAKQWRDDILARVEG